MRREGEFRIQDDAKIFDRGRKDDTGELRGKTSVINLSELPAGAKPHELSLRGIQAETIRRYPGSQGVGGLGHKADCSSSF